jgi:TPR repeat protein
MYYNGAGIKVNKEQAFKWYLTAAKLGESLAQFNTANLYYSGIGTSIDYKEALYWYQKAAAQGDEVARRNASLLEQRYK